MISPSSKGLAMRVLLSAAASAPFLHADEIPDPMRFGAEVLVASPLNDLRNMTGRTGLGGSLFAEQPFTNTSIIQTRASFITYGENKDLQAVRPYPFLPPKPLTLSINTAAISVEIRQYFHHTQGPFVLGGLSATRYEFRSAYLGTAVDQNGITIPGQYESKVKTSTKVGLALGLGYDFDDSTALTLRYTTMPIDGASLSALQAGLSFRFKSPR